MLTLGKRCCVKKVQFVKRVREFDQEDMKKSATAGLQR